jgi:acyl-CoA thioester hydrolase
MVDEMGPFNVYRTRVRAHQTDVNGAMYHGAYFDVFDDARIETFRRLGYDYARALENGWAPFIRRLKCEYYAPARMDDMLAIEVTVPHLTGATMTVQYSCRRDHQLLALGQVVFVFISPDGKPLRFPGDLRAMVESQPELMHVN